MQRTANENAACLRRIYLRQCPPKPYKLLNFFSRFVTTVKIPSCTYYLKEAEMKIAMFAPFKEYHGNQKGSRFGGPRFVPILIDKPTPGMKS